MRSTGGPKSEDTATLQHAGSGASSRSGPGSTWGTAGTSHCCCGPVDRDFQKGNRQAPGTTRRGEWNTANSGVPYILLSIQCCHWFVCCLSGYTSVPLRFSHALSCCTYVGNSLFSKAGLGGRRGRSALHYTLQWLIHFALISKLRFYCILFRFYLANFLVPFMPFPATGAKIVAIGRGWGGIISIFLDSREQVESIATKFVAIGYAKVFWKITESLKLILVSSGLIKRVTITSRRKKQILFSLDKISSASCHWYFSIHHSLTYLPLFYESSLSGAVTFDAHPSIDQFINSF